MIESAGRNPIDDSIRLLNPDDTDIFDEKDIVFVGEDGFPKSSAQNDKSERRISANIILGGVLTTFGVLCMAGGLYFAVNPQAAQQIVARITQGLGSEMLNYSILCVGLVGIGGVLTIAGAKLFARGREVRAVVPSKREDGKKLVEVNQLRSGINNLLAQLRMTANEEKKIEFELNEIVKVAHEKNKKRTDLNIEICQLEEMKSGLERKLNRINCESEGVSNELETVRVERERVEDRLDLTSLIESIREKAVQMDGPSEDIEKKTGIATIIMNLDRMAERIKNENFTKELDSMKMLSLENDLFYVLGVLEELKCFESRKPLPWPKGMKDEEKLKEMQRSIKGIRTLYPRLSEEFPEINFYLNSLSEEFLNYDSLEGINNNPVNIIQNTLLNKAGELLSKFTKPQAQLQDMGLLDDELDAFQGELEKGAKRDERELAALIEQEVANVEQEHQEMMTNAWKDSVAAQNQQIIGDIKEKIKSILPSEARKKLVESWLMEIEKELEENDQPNPKNLELVNKRLIELDALIESKESSPDRSKSVSKVKQD